VAPVVPASGAQFFESFDTPGSVGRFQVETFFGGGAGSDTTDGDWLGDHDMSCGAPTTTRTVHGNQPSEMVWYCAPGGDPTKGHIMTAASTEGYGQVDFSPNQSFSNVRRICWDQNLTDMGGRKWTQVIVLPESVYQHNGGHLHYARQDLMPDPAHGALSTGGGGLIMFVNGRIGFHNTSGPDGPTTGASAIAVAAPIWHDFDSVNGTTTADKAARYRQCVSETPAGVQVERDTAGGHHSGLVVGVHLPQGQVRVIFQDDTYDNFKGDLGDRSHGSDPRVTWHWDNIEID